MPNPYLTQGQQERQWPTQTGDSVPWWRMLLSGRQLPFLLPREPARRGVDPVAALVGQALATSQSPAQQRAVAMQDAPLYLQALSGLEQATAPLRVPAARAAYGFRAKALGEPDRSWSQVFRDMEEGGELPTVREAFLDIHERRALQAGKQPGWLGKLLVGTSGLALDLGMAPDVWLAGILSRGPVVGGAVLRSTARKAARRAAQTAVEEGLVSRATRPLIEGFLTESTIKFGSRVTPADLVAGARTTEALAAKMTGDIAGRMGLSTTATRKVVDTHLFGLQRLWTPQWRLGIPFTSRKMTPGRLPKGLRRPRLLQDQYNKDMEKLLVRAETMYEDTYVEKKLGVRFDPYPAQAREDMIQQIAKDMRGSQWWAETFRPRRGIPPALSLEAQTMAVRRSRMGEHWAALLNEPFRGLNAPQKRAVHYYIAEGPEMLPTVEQEPSTELIAAALSKYFGRTIEPGGVAGYRMTERIGKVIERTGEWAERHPVRVMEDLDDIVRPPGIRATAPMTEQLALAGQKGDTLYTMPSFMTRVGEAGIVEDIFEPVMMVDLAKLPPLTRRIVTAGEEHRRAMRQMYGVVQDEISRLQQLGMDVDFMGDLGTNYLHKMLLAGSRTPFGKADQAILHESFYRTPIEAAALRQLIDDPKMIQVFNTPEFRGLVSLDDVPIFAVDMEATNRAYARQMANIRMAGDIREMTLKYGVQTKGTPADVALGYSGLSRPYFPDLELELPVAVTEYLDHIGAIFHPEQSRWRQALSYPRRDALMSLTWILANVIDQLPSAALSGIATPKGYVQGMGIAARALAYDVARLSEISVPRTFFERARTSIARRLMHGMKMGGIDDDMASKIIREVTEGEGVQALGTGLMRQLTREAPGVAKRGILSDTALLKKLPPAARRATVAGEEFAERLFSNTIGLGVRAGSVMEDFARLTQYAAMRIDGLSPAAATSQLYKGWVNYNKAAQAVIDEWGRNFTFFYTYQRQRIPQYGAALTTRPWLMYIPSKAKDVHTRSIANKQQRAVFRWGAPEHMKANPDNQLASWDEYPFSYIMDEMNLTPEERQDIKQNVMCVIRPRWSMRETMGDINDLVAFHKLMEGEIPQPRVIQALQRRMAPPLQAYAYLEQDRFQDAMRAMSPSLSKWFYDRKLRHAGMAEKEVDRRRKRYKLKHLYGRPVSKVDERWWKLDLARQSTKMPWGGNWLAKGRIIDFLYIPSMIDRMTDEQKAAVGLR